MLADISLSNFSDATVYLVMATIGTVAFSIQVFMMLVFGHHGDFSGGGVDHPGDIGHDAGFTFFSLLSVVSFMMGAGWMGFLCRTDWGLSSFPSAFIALAFGMGLMLLSSGGMYALRRLQHAGHYDVAHTVGKTGRVYLTIPAKGAGAGQVELNVDGRRQLVPAVSSSQRIESFATVKILEARDDGVLVVEPV